MQGSRRSCKRTVRGGNTLCKYESTTSSICSCALQHGTIVIHQSWDIFGGAGEIHTNMDVYEQRLTNESRVRMSQKVMCLSLPRDVCESKSSVAFLQKRNSKY